MPRHNALPLETSSPPRPFAPATLAILLVAALASTALPTPADAQIVPIGNHFAISQSTTVCARSPKVAAAPDGRFIVVWSNTDTQTVLARLYDADGAPVANQQTIVSTGSGESPDAAMESDGEFVIVWSASTRIEGQRFDSAGMPIGAVFTVDSSTGNHGAPRVAMTDAGAFVVTWDLDDGSEENILARRYDETGAAVGSTFTVDTTTGFDLIVPDIAIEPDGDSFVVVWQEFPAAGTDIKARRFDSAGAPVGSELRVNSDPAGFQISPSVALDADGAFVVTWHGTIPAGGGVGAIESVYAADNSFVRESRIGNASLSELSAKVALSNDGGGRFAVFLQNPVGVDGRDLRVSAQEENDLLLIADQPGTLDLGATLDDRERAIVVWRDGTSDEACPSVSGQRIQTYQLLDSSPQNDRVHSLSQQAAWKQYVYFPSSPPAQLDILLQPPATSPRDVDLYVQFGDFPNLANFDCRPFQGASSPETCTVFSTGVPILIGVNGWEVGGIDFTLTVTETPMLFYDGFESGDTSAWGTVVP